MADERYNSETAASGEVHLIVLWERARKFEERILGDISRHVRVLATFTQRWPSSPEEGYARFYGAKASLAVGKVKSCGGGEFRSVIVCDERPRYGWKKTSRGTEPVNMRMFAMKQRYRNWCGSSHCVHSTNSPSEAQRDIFLLTGRTVDEWRRDFSIEGLKIFAPGSEKLEDPGAANHFDLEPTASNANRFMKFCQTVFPVTGLQFERSVNRILGLSFRELRFVGEAENAGQCRVSYCTYGRETLVTAWDFGREFHRSFPQNCFRPLFFRMDRSGERFGIFVQEHFPGRSLRAAIREGLSGTEARAIGEELVKIADRLAGLGICHRDISPDTIWLSEDGRVRLDGFNFAIRLADGREIGWLARNPGILAGLGGGYRVDAGRWSDAVAVSGCISQLPAFPGRDEMVAALLNRGKMCQIRVRPGALSKSFLLFMRLSVRNLLRSVRGKMCRDRDLMTLLAHLFRLPVRGNDGWRDLPSVFDALKDGCDYVVLRNYEMLPDDFDPALHGDIDLLVDDLERAVELLAARKVVRKSWRVHYEITVSGRPVRLDLRYVGDGYYCEQWERDILRSRLRTAEGVYVPKPEDAFYSLVYHALFQKRSIAVDYPARAAALAEKAGIAGGSFDDWRPELVSFMRKRGYVATRPTDRSVKYNAEAVAGAFADV